MEVGTVKGEAISRGIGKNRSRTKGRFLGLVSIGALRIGWRLTACAGTEVPAGEEKPPTAAAADVAAAPAPVNDATPLHPEVDALFDWRDAAGLGRLAAGDDPVAAWQAQVCLAVLDVETALTMSQAMGGPKGSDVPIWKEFVESKVLGPLFTEPPSPELRAWSLRVAHPTAAEGVAATASPELAARYAAAFPDSPFVDAKSGAFKAPAPRAKDAKPPASAAKDGGTFSLTDKDLGGAGRGDASYVPPSLSGEPDQGMDPDAMQRAMPGGPGKPELLNGSEVGLSSGILEIRQLYIDARSDSVDFGMTLENKSDYLIVAFGIEVAMLRGRSQIGAVPMVVQQEVPAKAKQEFQLQWDNKEGAGNVTWEPRLRFVIVQLPDGRKVEASEQYTIRFR